MRAKLFVMQALPPGRPPFPAGLVLQDIESEQYRVRVRTEWSEFSDDQDIEILEAFGEAFRTQLESGQTDLLTELLKSGSHVLRIEDHGTIEIESLERELGVRADELGIR